MLSKTAQKIRQLTLKMITEAKASHIGSSFSIVEILTALYFGDILKIDPQNPDDPKRDIFILSKGHGCASLYATLALRGFFPEEVLYKEFYTDGGRLTGHPSFKLIPGIEVATGALGHGLSMGVGFAKAAKIDAKKTKTFVVLGDGECNEGAVWEAALFAGQHKLDNLTVIVDYNQLQGLGCSKDVLCMDPFKEKWAAFGWEAKEVDGHNLEELTEVLKKVPFKEGKPNAIIAHTVKGKGVSYMEGELAWHYKSPNEEEFKQAVKELS